MDVVGGFDISIKGWGLEDVDIFEKFVVYLEIEVFCLVDFGVIYVYYKVNCDLNFFVI